MSTTKEEPKEKVNLEKEIENKLSDLLTLGWTLTDEICPLESCDCPLLKSFDGNKYCVKCEMWQFPDKVQARQKYTDLVLKHQELTLKETGLSKLYNKGLNFKNFGKESVLNSLKVKLAYLSSILNQTFDQVKTQQILQNIDLCLKNIKTINESL